MLGVYHKIQEICSKMGTKIFKIYGEMPNAEFEEYKSSNECYLLEFTFVMKSSHVRIVMARI